jgi:hypothetical protein
LFDIDTALTNSKDLILPIAEADKTPEHFEVHIPCPSSIAPGGQKSRVWTNCITMSARHDDTLTIQANDLTQNPL